MLHVKLLHHYKLFYHVKLLKLLLVPKISYVKGIDVYLVMCFFMTFACVIEYGLVSFIHRREQQKRTFKRSNQSSLNTLSLKKQSYLGSIKNRKTQLNSNLNNSPLMWRKNVKNEADVSRYANESTELSNSNLKNTSCSTQKVSSLKHSRRDVRSPCFNNSFTFIIKFSIN